MKGGQRGQKGEGGGTEAKMGQADKAGVGRARIERNSDERQGERVTEGGTLFRGFLWSLITNPVPLSLSG